MNAQDSKDGKAADELALLVDVLKLASLINRPMRDAVAQANALSINELRVLMALDGEGACAGHELSELIGMPPMNVSRALASLVESGLGVELEDQSNRRRKPFRLTPAGHAAARALEPHLGQLAAFLLEPLDNTERAALSAILAKLEPHLRDWPGARPSAS